MRQKRLLLLAVLILVMLPVLPGTALEPALFDRRGVIDQVSFREKRLIIYDTSYLFPAATPVYRYIPRRDDRDSWTRVDQKRLRPGMRVGYAVARTKAVHGQQVLTAVWILPRRGRR